MKNSTTLLALLFCALLSAQNIQSNRINYQGVARDASGDLIAETTINLQLAIRLGAPDVAADYVEDHAVTTDAAGVFSVLLGEGTPVSGTYDAIPWGDLAPYLTVSLNGEELGTTEIHAVPFALNSEKALGMNLADLNDVDNTNPATGQVLQWDGSDWVPATDTELWTANGNEISYTSGGVGVAVADPEDGMELHVGGDILIQSNLGALHIGYPQDGNRWRLATTNSGADLLFRSRPSGSSSYDTRFFMSQTGEFGLGNTVSSNAWLQISNNSSVAKPHLQLNETQNEFARLEFTNTTAPNSFWHIAGFPSETASSGLLNFYFSNTSGAADRMTLTGDGELGINGTPTARLEIFQQGQAVGTGLRFDDGTANQDWDITHGFSLRFHYGGALRGFINANTGEYVQSSDRSLKTKIEPLPTLLGKVMQLNPSAYHYKSAEPGSRTLGLIAQEVQVLFPELVHYSEVDDVYGINYAGFSVVAIKTIQEQQQIIANLEARLAALEAKMN
ncbi:tail fiber domain-containing protein [Croceiramulus getboli]|nr:tail fiber domain-containing protein [Flavobacteriaceae bacterium YJPT1-3]